jgi:hypothetical protein
MSNPIPQQYPHLEEILRIQNRAIKPMYSTRDVADIFHVSPRSIQNRIAAGQLVPRDLPGRAKFLPQDIEDFLVLSRRESCQEDEVLLAA